MKKVLCLILTCLIFISMAFTSFAAEYEVRKAAVIPTIDGNVDLNEWKDAKVATVDRNMPLTDNGKLDSNIVVDNYLMWTEEGLYGAAIAKNDPTIGKAVKGQIDKRGDGVQLLLDPMNRKTESGPFGEAYIFDFYVDEAYWHEHFVYKELPQNSGIQLKASRSGDSWMIEYFLPWNMLRHTGETFEVKDGTKMGFGFLVQDYSEEQGVSRMYAMNKGWSLSQYETFALSAKTAGAAPASEQAKAEPAAEQAKAEPAAAKAANPKTGDYGVVQLALLAIVSVSSYAGIKRIRNK